MSEQRVVPTIGLTLSSEATAERVAEYRKALECQGAAVCEVTAKAPRAIEAFDGLLFAGGGDVCPEFDAYESPPDGRLLQGCCPGRDKLELDLCRAALDRAAPILGICRGAQVLGVALGGRLMWDIGAQMRDAKPHRMAAGKGDACHLVRIARDSKLREILEADEIWVNSFHHQAVVSLGEQCRAVAWSEDGVIEAIEVVGEGVVLGVQWHPERMASDERQRRLFEAFAAAAGECARKRPHWAGGGST